jgi:hypothetical protein
MAAIYQVVWEWNGSPGLPGFTNLFFDATADSPTDALAAATKSRLLFSGVAGSIPSTVTLSLRADVRVLSDSDGSLLNIYTVVGPANITGGAAAAYASPVGACVDWVTTTVHGTRRMQGRTFLVPLTGSVFDGTGSLTPAFITSLGTAAEAMRTGTGPAFGVWGRPRLADPGHVPPITARAGLWGPAVSSRIPDKAVVLTSRRD